MTMSQGGSEGDSGTGRGRNTAAWITAAGAVVAAVITGIFFLIAGRSGSAGSTDIPPSSPLSAPAGTASPGVSVPGSLVTLASAGVDTVAYSVDGHYLAAGNKDGVVRVWKTSNWQVASLMTDPASKGVTSVAFNRENSLLAAGDANGHVYVWASGHATPLTDPSGAAIQSVAFSADNNYLAAGDAGGMVNVWQTSNWQLVSSVTDPGSAGVTSVVFNPDNSVLAAGDANGHIYLWAGNHMTALADPDGAAVEAVLFTADNRALVSGDSAGYVDVWHVGTGGPWLTLLSAAHYDVSEALLDPGSGGVKGLAFDASTRAIAAADENGRVYLWRYKSVPSAQFEYAAGSAVLAVAYSPDDSHLAVASANGNVYVRPLPG
jgi:WD40 repeat protein